MNDCDAWGTLIESVGSVCADWVCLFASEVDAVLDSFETIYGLRHRVISHWHGPGSYAMAVAVNSKYDRLVKSVECMGRECVCTIAMALAPTRLSYLPTVAMGTHLITAVRMLLPW